MQSMRLKSWSWLSMRFLCVMTITCASCEATGWPPDQEESSMLGSPVSTMSASSIMKSHESNLTLRDSFSLDTFVAFVLEARGQLDDTVRLHQVLRRGIALAALCLGLLKIADLVGSVLLTKTGFQLMYGSLQSAPYSQPLEHLTPLWP